MHYKVRTPRLDELKRPLITFGFDKSVTSDAGYLPEILRSMFIEM